jgi:hypothetical protein
MADEIDISRQLEESIRQSRKIQQDANSELNKSINLLSKINDLRDASISKVKALNKETINTKDIQKELQKAKEKEILTSKKIDDIQKSMSAAERQNSKDYIFRIEQRKKLESELARATLAGNAGQKQFLQNQLSLVDADILLKESSLNIDERRYAAALQANKTAQETNQLLREELDTEKQIEKSIGLSGKALGLFANKLGLGTKFYGDMVEKARDLNEEGKKLTFGDKLSALGKTAGAGLKEAITDPLTAIPIAGAAIGGIVSALKSVFDFIVGIQDQTVKFARAMNLSTDQARAIKMEFASLSISSGDLFINSQKMVESQMELADSLGVTNRLTNEQLATNIKLRDIAGLDLETRKGIVEASTLTGQSSEGITKSVLSQVAGLKQATGISFNYQKILKEASNLGGYLGLTFAKYPEKLTKSLVTVKSMGMELKQLDSIADSFLDFESSISKEFEAQLLTGKQINLTKAREAFLNNDLATAAKEITTQVGSAQDFLKLNRIQAESLASAFGMSRDQMGDMLKQQELLSKLGAKDLKDAQAKVQALKAQGKSKEDIIRLTGEEAYQNLTNASLQEKIGGFMEKIKQSIADFVEKSGIIEKIEGFFEYISKPENIKAVISKLRDFFAFAVEAVLGIANGLINAIDFITFGFGIDESFERKFEAFAKDAPNRIRSLGGDFGGVSVGDKAATSTTTNNVTSTTQDNMSMARGSGNQPKVYVMVTVDPITGKSVEKVVTQEYFETQFGQMAKQ